MKVLAGLALTLALSVHGAIPFLSMPTLGQAVWLSSFAQSFANQGLFALHAANMGQPAVASIAFGLTGAYPEGLLIRIGLRPADAYTLMTAGWLCVAFVGALRFALRLGAGARASIVLAALWLCSPIVWGHVDYSMLSIGIALLPTYFWALFALLQAERAGSRRFVSAVLAFALAAVIAIFTDGYTFMMFALGSAVLYAWTLARQRERRRYLLSACAPALGASFVIAYVLYAAYIGRGEFAPEPLAMFRAWGVDVGYLLIPTQRVHWLLDLLHLSVLRQESNQWGNATNWATTFLLPSLLLGGVAWWKLRRQSMWSGGVLLVALFGLYMALGPSLKVFSVRADPQRDAAAMQAADAGPATGNAWISGHVPGFRSMRASYRWIALSSLGLWWLAALLAAKMEQGGRERAFLMLAALVLLLYLPHPSRAIDALAYRAQFKQIDHDLGDELATAIHHHELVAFLPYRNDFLAGYVAARDDFRTYNIGGDKNLAYARASWPRNLRSFEMGVVDAGFVERVAGLLAAKEADAVVLPYFDSLWGSHYWPCERLLSVKVTPDLRRRAKDASWLCPDEWKVQLRPTVQALRQLPQLKVEEHPLFVVVRLASSAQAVAPAIEAGAVRYPVAIEVGNPALPQLLGPGWHEPEVGHVWSKTDARLQLPRPESCKDDSCMLVLGMTAFNASAGHAVEVRTTLGERTACFAFKDAQMRQIALKAGAGTQPLQLALRVPGAVSPAEAGKGADQRVLGVALITVDLSSRGGDAALAVEEASCSN